MLPPSEHVHWWFATGCLLLGLLRLAEAVVGPEVWERRRWRVYLWPGLAFALGVGMWPVMVLFTNSAIHMVAHGSWAQALMLTGGAELGLAAGKLHSRWWKLATPIALALGGLAFLLHEQNTWLFQRSAFLHHLAGWTLVIGAVFPLLQAVRPRWSFTASLGYAATFLVLAVILYSDRDVAPIFGHLSRLAGVPHR